MRRAGSLAVVGANIDSSRDFTEMSARLHITGEGSVLTLFRTGELMAYNEAEKHIYRLCAQDESRHVAFGVSYMEQFVQTLSPQEVEERALFAFEACRVIRAFHLAIQRNVALDQDRAHRDGADRNRDPALVTGIADEGMNLP